MAYENSKMEMESLWKCNEKVGNLRKSARPITFLLVKPEILVEWKAPQVSTFACSLVCKSTMGTAHASHV